MQPHPASLDSAALSAVKANQAAAQRFIKRRALEDIAPYYVERRGACFALICPEQGVIADDFGAYASACYHAHDLLDQAADEAAAEAAELAAEIESDEYDRLIRLAIDTVNAQGGYVAPSDTQGQARGRAQDKALADLAALAAGRAVPSIVSLAA